MAACPAAATEHLAPVTLDEPVHPLQRADVSGNAVIGVVPAESDVERVDLFLDRQVSDLPHLVAQLHQAAPQALLLDAHPNLEVALQVACAVQREAQEIDRFRALPAVSVRMLLREPAKFDQFGLGRFER